MCGFVLFSQFMGTQKQDASPKSKSGQFELSPSLLPSHFLQTAETPLAELPEFPPAEFGLSPAADQLPVCPTDESASEVLSAAAHCSAGKTHPDKQTWVQLVSRLEGT